MPHDHEQPHTLLPSEPALRVRAIETLLVDKGLVDPAAIDSVVDAFSNRIGPKNGARVVARAWSDPSYRQWLLRDATAAIADLGFSGLQGEHMVAVENTNGVHNVVVCTLCSCYPWPTLGVPPVWYKSPEYRARVVRDPRGVLAEFGVTLHDDVEVHVWDSTAEIRYLVIPQRPVGSACGARHPRFDDWNRPCCGTWRCVMDGVHDLGGMEGFGRLPLEENEPAFHYVWEARVMGMRLLMGGWRKWNIDAGRHSVELLPPKDYLSLTYYEKWLASLVNQSVKAGLITREEVARGRPEEGAVKASPPLSADAFLAFIPKGRPSARQITAEPAFRVGDQVHTARHMHSGHTRLPRYLRDCVGEVVRHHGPHVFPDVSATLQGEAPEHLYSVRFSATDVWGTRASSKDSVTADLWESYLAAER